MSELPPFDESARCAKCGYDAIHTRYEGKLHQGCTASEAYAGWLSVTAWGVGVTEEIAAEWQGYMEAVPDHVERSCSRCAHQWAEAVVGTDSPDVQARIDRRVAELAGTVFSGGRP
jgi:hypothetical protein